MAEESVAEYIAVIWSRSQQPRMVEKRRQFFKQFSTSHLSSGLLSHFTNCIREWLYETHLYCLRIIKVNNYTSIQHYIRFMIYTSICMFIFITPIGELRLNFYTARYSKYNISKTTSICWMGFYNFLSPTFFSYTQVCCWFVPNSTNNYDLGVTKMVNRIDNGIYILTWSESLICLCILYI